MKFTPFFDTGATNVPPIHDKNYISSQTNLFQRNHKIRVADIKNKEKCIQNLIKCNAHDFKIGDNDSKMSN